MEYHIIVINIFLIFALILVGFVAGKAHLVSEQASKDLSAILVESRFLPVYFLLCSGNWRRIF